MIKVGDILISKKSNTPGYSLDWRPAIHLNEDFPYIVSFVDEDDIGFISHDKTEVDFFGFDSNRANHWEKWFYTKADFRDKKLKELGI